MTVHTKTESVRISGLPELSKCAKNLELSEKVCNCKHEIQGTGGVFLQSLGIILCNECKGEQKIKRPIK